MIDTHTHLYDEVFDADLTEVVGRALQSGVDRFVFPGIDSSYHGRMMKRVEALEGMAFPAIGLHPTSVDANWRKELDFVEKHLEDYPFTAIGEIGIDGYWSKEFIAEQKEVFRTQMVWASQRDLPAIIHVRDATEEVFEVLDSLKKEGVPMKGVFHAYAGSYETYLRILSYGGFKVGIGGVVTYKKASIAQSLERIALSDILLETDSPWLTPVPYRGKRNEPSYVRLVAEKIAQIKGVSVEEVDKATTENAEKMFGLLRASPSQ